MGEGETFGIGNWVLDIGDWAVGGHWGLAARFS